MVGQSVRRGLSFMVATVLAAGLAGCGDGGSAVETRDRSADAPQALLATAPAPESGPADIAPVPLAEAAPDKPVMTSNRRETTDAKIERLFRTNGEDFGAATAEDYLRQVQAFTTRPPAGTERVERANGDILLYQASTNTFAVVSRQGVPKTMFKPRGGAEYWAEQKAAAPTFGRRRNNS